ncbi:uncharacterized protein STEHIDRAFT_156532 [Stereum hirsutum FP-91666 SS1]|uniref:uncharacterized protein n=1 Tax=Stereum hirsutum (strain FP-91666) TaxID=721885 RepID=UPI000440A49D|nr:uncharacterized protein STEHIDRAFT_156532 [Stereum hirsutum FP-91666 SS1]EIM87578.1 hypothetical protein STEHIDRAFT_156532 [Stereum hirsutum FP-91666 SS1]
MAYYVQSPFTPWAQYSTSNSAHLSPFHTSFTSFDSQPQPSTVLATSPLSSFPTSSSISSLNSLSSTVGNYDPSQEELDHFDSPKDPQGLSAPTAFQSSYQSSFTITAFRSPESRRIIQRRPGFSVSAGSKELVILATRNERQKRINELTRQVLFSSANPRQQHSAYKQQTQYTTQPPIHSNANTNLSPPRGRLVRGGARPVSSESHNRVTMSPMSYSPASTPGLRLVNHGVRQERSRRVEEFEPQEELEELDIVDIGSATDVSTSVSYDIRRSTGVGGLGLGVGLSPIGPRVEVDRNSWQPHRPASLDGSDDIDEVFTPTVIYSTSRQRPSSKVYSNEDYPSFAPNVRRKHANVDEDKENGLETASMSSSSSSTSLSSLRRLAIGSTLVKGVVHRLSQQFSSPKSPSKSPSTAVFTPAPSLTSKFSSRANSKPTSRSKGRGGRKSKSIPKFEVDTTATSAPRRRSYTSEPFGPGSFGIGSDCENVMAGRGGYVAKNPEIEHWPSESVSRAFGRRIL